MANKRSPNLQTIRKKLRRWTALRLRRSAQLANNNVTFAAARRRGKTHYHWISRRDNRVRHTHKILHSQIFNMYDGAMDPLTGGPLNPHYPNQKHPGEEFGCRCHARWI